MKKPDGLSKVLIVSVILFAGAAFAFAIPAPKGLTLMAAFEGGTLYRTGQGEAGSYPVVMLKGGWREMGRQYGRLLSSDLKAFYTLAVEETLFGAGETYDHLLKISSGFFAPYPQKHKDFLYGMAETSGLTLEQHIMLNVVDPYVEIFGPDIEAKRLACSAIAAWGPYSLDGTLVMGRNYDYAIAYKKFNPFLAVVVMDAEGEPNKTASIHWIGTTLTQNGMNDKGIFLELDTDMYTVSPTFRNRVPVVSLLLSFLQENSTLDQIDASFAANSSDFGCIIQVADDSSAYSYEWPPYGVRRRSESGREGLLVATNNFVPPLPEAWLAAGYPAEPAVEDKRRAHLLALGDSYKGRIDVTAMKEIMDVNYEDGGARHARTIYQLIAVPGSRALWIRGFDYSDWVEIDLGALFAP